MKTVPLADLSVAIKKVIGAKKVVVKEETLKSLRELLETTDTFNEFEDAEDDSSMTLGFFDPSGDHASYPNANDATMKDVCNIFCRYVQDTITKTVESRSSTSLPRKELEGRQLIETTERLLRKAVNCSSGVTCSTVLKYFHTLLNYNQLRESFVDACSKSIIDFLRSGVPCSTAEEELKMLLNFYMEKFSSHSNKGIILRALTSLIKSLSSVSTVETGQLLSFFCDVQIEHSDANFINLMELILLVVRLNGTSNLILLARTTLLQTEKVVNDLSLSLRHSHPKTIEFLRLTIGIHHLGKMSSVLNCHSCWRSIISGLITKIRNEFSDIARTKFSQESENISTWIELAADVYNEVFRVDGNSFSFVTVREKEPSALKKFKIDISLDSLLEEALTDRPVREAAQVIPWLKLLNELFLKYPTHSKKIDVTTTVQRVNRCTRNWYRNELVRGLLFTLQLRLFSSATDLEMENVFQESASLLNELWDSVFRSLQSKTCGNEALRLLHFLIKCKYFQTSRDIFLVFRLNSNDKPSAKTLEILLLLLKTSYYSSHRKQILSWIFSVDFKCVCADEAVDWYPMDRDQLFRNFLKHSVNDFLMCCDVIPYVALCRKSLLITRESGQKELSQDLIQQFRECLQGHQCQSSQNSPQNLCYLTVDQKGHCFDNLYTFVLSFTKYVRTVEFHDLSQKVEAFSKCVCLITSFAMASIQCSIFFNHQNKAADRVNCLLEELYEFLLSSTSKPLLRKQKPLVNYILCYIPDAIVGATRDCLKWRLGSVPLALVETLISEEEDAHSRTNMEIFTQYLHIHREVIVEDSPVYFLVQNKLFLRTPTIRLAPVLIESLNSAFKNSNLPRHMCADMVKCLTKEASDSPAPSSSNVTALRKIVFTFVSERDKTCSVTLSTMKLVMEYFTRLNISGVHLPSSTKANIVDILYSLVSFFGAKDLAVQKLLDVLWQYIKSADRQTQFHALKNLKILETIESSMEHVEVSQQILDVVIMILGEAISTNDKFDAHRFLVLGLGTVMQHCIALERSCLCILLENLDLESPIVLDLCKETLSVVAHCRGLKFPQYLEYHLKYILCRWMKENNPLSKFPYRLFEESNLRNFILNNARTLAYSVIRSGKSEILEEQFDDKVELKRVIADVTPSLAIWLFLPKALEKKQIIVDDNVECFCRNVSYFVSSQKWQKSDIVKLHLTSIILESLRSFPADLKALEDDSLLPEEHIDALLDCIFDLYPNPPNQSFGAILLDHRADSLFHILAELRGKLFENYYESDVHRLARAYCKLASKILQENLNFIGKTVVNEISWTLCSGLRVWHLKDVNNLIFPILMDAVKTLTGGEGFCEVKLKILRRILLAVLSYSDFKTEQYDTVFVNNARAICLKAWKIKITSIAPITPKLCKTLSLDFNYVEFFSAVDQSIALDRSYFYYVGNALLETLTLEDTYSSFAENLKLRNLIHEITLHLLEISQENEFKDLAGKCLGALPFSSTGKTYRNALEMTTHDDSPAVLQREGLASVAMHLLSCVWNSDACIVSLALESLKSFKSLCPNDEFNDLTSNETTELLNSLIETRSNACSFAKLTSNQHNMLSVVFNNDSLWLPEMRYESWIKELVLALLSTLDLNVPFMKFLTCLIPLCKVLVTTCEVVFPVIVEALLLTDSNFSKVLSKKLSAYIQQQTTSLNSCSVAADVRFVRIMLKVVSYVSGLKHIRSNCWTKDFVLDMNFLLLSEAAMAASLPYRAIFYCDINFYKLRSSNSKMSSIGSIESPDNDRLYRLMLKAYQDVGNIDGVFGCFRLIDTMQPDHWITYVYEKKWDKVLYQFRKQKQCENTYHAQALIQCGFDNFIDYSKRNSTKRSLNEEVYYEHCWRLSRWKDVEEEDFNESNSMAFNRCVFEATKTLFEDNKSTALFIKIGREDIVQTLRNSKFKSRHSYINSLKHFQMLNFLENSLLFSDGESTIASLCNKWNLRIDAIKRCSDFEAVEPISWLQAVVLKKYADKFNDFEDYIKQVEKHVQQALDDGDIFTARRSLECLEPLQEMRKDVRYLCSSLQAKTYWLMDETELAKKELSSLIKDLKRDPDAKKIMLASALTLYAQWASATKSENATDLMKNYFEDALKIVGRDSKSDAAVKIHSLIAQFADEQYLNVLHSHKIKLDRLNKSKQSLKNLSMTISSSEEDRAKKRALEKNQNIDIEDLEKTEKEKDEMLLQALGNYYRCLSINDENDIMIFRLASLWFSNKSNESIMRQMKQVMSDLPSYKFLPLVYQLAARISTVPGSQISLLSNLNLLIFKLAQEHPHHVIPVLLALVNGDKDGNSTRRLSSRTIPRQETAKKLFDKLKDAKKLTLFATIKNYESLSDDYMKLAAMKKSSSETFRLPQELFIAKVTPNEKVPIMTDEVKVHKNCNYDDLPIISSVCREVTVCQCGTRVCGGNSKPKLIEVTGSDGKLRRQLAKGEDVRQDAIMEQAFELANNLLRQNPITKHQNLKVNTYKVVPLSRKVGIVEWCDGTIPLKQCLYKMHLKYQPKDDLSPSSCFAILKNAQRLPPQTKLLHYVGLCQKIKPALHYFFLENFSNPQDWFAKQIAYTKSVATTSVLGYLFGIGDRHCNNILINAQTAEVTHIDFGIVFELGKTLPIPETVPFRLTRDVVDGMGACGVEGVFRRNCERILEVMKASKTSVMTILDVLLHDPLYGWQVLPNKVRMQHYPNLLHVEDKDADPGTEIDGGAAERTLHCVERKLQGFEGNSQLSVSGQINVIIQQAMDPINLSRLYCGWEPYL